MAMFRGSKRMTDEPRDKTAVPALQRTAHPWAPGFFRGFVTG
jgi:hypothetical protein